MWSVNVTGELDDWQQRGDGLAVVANDDEELNVHVEGPAADGWPVPEVACRFCPWVGGRDELELQEDDDGKSEACPECGEGDIKDYDPRPIHWCNSAGVRMRGQEVQVSISLGDPRGALTMMARRTTDGRLLVHVPYPEQTYSHVGLREIHEGTFQVVEHEEARSRARIYEEALRELVEEGGEELPEYRDWGGDTEEAERWGLRAGAHEAGRRAARALKEARKLGEL